MKIAVVGTGYVGLVAGACFAENGNDVICVDKDPAKVRLLQRGKIPIYEPGLEELVRRNRSEKRLTFTTDARPRGVAQSQIIFIAVGTPTGEDGSADLQHVLGGGARHRHGDERLQGHRQQEHGAGRHRRQGPRRSSRRETTHPFSVVSNPEFLKQGAAIDDFMKPDRVVIGAEDPRAAELMTRALRAVHPDRRADHADGLRQRRAVQVRGERDAGDAHLVHERGRRTSARRSAPTSTRSGRRSRPTAASARRSCFPGVGYGGSCFPEGRQGDAAVRRRQGLRLPDPAGGRRRSTSSRSCGCSTRCKTHFGSLKGKRIAVWGLAFKPRTDDMREAPAVPLIKGLLARRRDGAGLRSRGDEGRQGHLRHRRSPTPRTATPR